MARPQDFYDELAPDYHLLFDDWWSAALDHAEVISGLLTERGVPAGSRLRDCTCGIGTQALPLTALGYEVTATDISPRSVERAQAEADRRNLHLRLAVADVRRVDEVTDGLFDAVISCDNALPHLLTDEDPGQAIRSIRACLRDGGVFLASVRDYDTLAANRPTGTPVSIHGDVGSRHASGQAWAWPADGHEVHITLFVLTESGEGVWHAAAPETTYRALRRETLTSALRSNGFSAVEWLLPGETGYHQPVVAAIAQP